MIKAVKVFLLHTLFGLRPSEICEILDIKSPSLVSRQIRNVSDQLICGELSFIDATPEEIEAARKRLESARTKKRAYDIKNKDRANALRRESYARKKALS